MTNLSPRNDRTLATSLVDPVNEGQISQNGVNTFDVSAFQAIFVDSFTDPLNPDVTYVDSPAQLNIPITNIGFVISFIYADVNGVIQQETTLQQGEYLRDHVALGIVNHDTAGNITSISSPTQVSSISAQMSFTDLSTAMTPILATQGDRNIVSGGSGSLKLNKTSGIWYNFALNARNTNKDPNFVFSQAFDSVPLIVAWRSIGSQDGFKAFIQTDVLLRWDDGTATDADPLPQGILGDYEYVNHRVVQAINEDSQGNTPLFGLQIGQKKYPSKFAAIHGFASEVYETFDTFKGGGVVATVTVRGGSTDLSDPDDFDVRQAIPARGEYR